MSRICAAILPLVAALAVLSSARTAAAEPTQIGGWFCPPFFSPHSLLGYIEDAPAHPELENGMELGARIGKPFLSWLVPELELGFSPTQTTAVGGAKSANVFWFEPRLQVRFDLLHGRRIEPFVLLGG